MKKSNIIILLMVIFVLVTIALLVITKSNGKELSKKCSLQKEFALSDFSVVVGEPGSWFEVRSGDSNIIIVKHDGKKDIRTDFYRVKNDTLYFSKREKPNSKVKYIVQCKNLKTIHIMKGSACFVAGFKAKSLNIIVNDGQFLIDEDRNYVSLKDFWFEVEQLNVKANKGVLLFQNTIITSANIRMNNTSGMFLIENYIGNLDLQLTDSSNIHYPNASNSGNICNTNIKADATSKFEIVKR